MKTSYFRRVVLLASFGLAFLSYETITVLVREFTPLSRTLAKERDIPGTILSVDKGVVLAHFPEVGFILLPGTMNSKHGITNDQPVKVKASFLRKQLFPTEE